MKSFFVKSLIIVFVLIAGISLFTTTASAQIEPYLYFGGNYDYTGGVLSFTDNYADWIDYIDYSDPSSDPILGAALSFGTLTNSGPNPLVFSPSTFTVDGFFTATLNNFVVNNSELMWGSLDNIVRLDSGSSRYVDELLANGGGRGNIYMTFMPTVGGIEDFSADSAGAVGGMVAAPEPISAILFITGGLTLAFRSHRKKRI